MSTTVRICVSNFYPPSPAPIAFWSGFSVTPNYYFEGTAAASISNNNLYFNPPSEVTYFNSDSSQDPGGTINTAGCLNLTYLDVANLDLVGLLLNDCSSLQQLRCFDNYLPSLDVTNCPELTQIVCSLNRMTSFNITGCSKLTSLEGQALYSLSHQQGNINTTVNITDCPELISVDLRNNYFDQATIDSILVTLVANGKNNGTVKLTSFTPAAGPAPSSTGLAAKATLQSRGWVVLTN